MNRRLVVLWDPENPLIRVRSLIAALKERVDVIDVTFRESSHRTLPNDAFELLQCLGSQEIDGLLWVEGGPLPRDLESFEAPKAAWLLNDHAEPTLIDDLRGRFDRQLVSLLRHSAEPNSGWMPPCAEDSNPAMGISIFTDDPAPPAQVALDIAIREALESLPVPKTPVHFSLGHAGRVHSRLFDSLRSGAAVVVDSETDLRGIAHAGDHLEVLPQNGHLREFVQDLIRDETRLARLASRGPEIVSHLHSPSVRAADLCDALWPRREILGGKDFRPVVSLLVTCHRFRRRLRFCLESLARQELPQGVLEVVVADPESPDGLAEYLREFAESSPHLRVVRLPLDARYCRNRGYSIDRAFEASSGDVVIGIDGDIVFSPHLVGQLADSVLVSPGNVFGVRRVFLDRSTTELILAGSGDPFRDFERLSLADGDGQENSFVGVLGYCQATTRAAFAKARYPREFDMVNQSDIVFVERLEKEAGVKPRFLGEAKVLHLWHPRNWAGTSELL